MKALQGLSGLSISGRNYFGGLRMNHFNVPLHNTRLTIAPSSRSATTRGAAADNAFLNFVHACKNFVASRRVVSEVSCHFHGWLALSVVCSASLCCASGASAQTTNGVVTAWGYNYYGQCTIPASANSGVSAIAGGRNHTIALKGGAVLAWGYNDYGQCTIPDSANSGVSAIAGGGDHTIALKGGAVLAWGNNNWGQCTIPDSAISGVSAIAGGGDHTIALKGGAVLAWGYNDYGQCTIPALSLSGVTAISSGSQHTIALYPFKDCNNNGTDDFIEITRLEQSDCNVNGILDSCDLLSGVLVDANLNGIPDSCELAGPFGVVRAWGDGVPTPPSNLGLCSQVAAAGNAGSLALQANGIVVSWGNPGLVIPSDLGQCKAIAVRGKYDWMSAPSAMAIRKNSTVWSTSGVPADLTTCTKISMSASHSVALQTNGLVRAWHTDYLFGLYVPANLGKCIDIAAGGGQYGTGQFTVAIQENGTFQGWGDNSKGQCTAPSNLGPCIQIAASKSYYDHFCAAIQSAGTVAVWGYSGSGQTTIPLDLGACSKIVISEYTILALQTNGMVRTWGGFNVPPDLGAATAIAHGSNFALAIQMDCDTNGAPDAVQTVANPLLDLNHNYQLDSCEIQQGYEEDCNKNQIIDSAEPNYYAPVTLNSGHLSPIGYGKNQTWNIQTPALAISDPVLHLSMKGDLSLTMEYVTVYMNQRFMGVYFKYPSSDCVAVNQDISIPLEIFNSLIQSGAVGTSDLAIEIIPSVAVDPNLCLNGTWVEATLSYTSALTKDCNANGLLDSCEVALIPSLDTNNNGRLDECEGPGFQAPCIGDLDQNRFVDSSDVGIVLLNIGYLTMPGDPMDFDANGIIDNGDIGFVLLNTGECP